MSHLFGLENKQEFFPLQPEFIQKMKNYIEYKPINAPSDDIILYYQYEAESHVTNTFSVFPDAVFDLVFCCCEKDHTSFLWTSPAQKSEQFEIRHTCKYFGVRFSPKQKILDLNCTMKELLNMQAPLADVANIPPQVIEEIKMASSFFERIKVFEKLFVNPARKIEKHEIVDYCVNKIYSQNGKIKINELVEDTGYSGRYIRLLFEEHVGFSPKEFSDIIRFQRSLAMVLDDEPRDMLEIAYDNGYHDQAHFIRSFKRHALTTPVAYKRYLNELNKMDLTQSSV